MAIILVVDDEAPVRDIVSRLLKLHGHEVDAARDGGEAIDMLQKRAYDLMIIDRNMPRLNGLEAVAMIRSSRRFTRLKILMATGADVTKDVDAAFEAGVDGYVVKPFDMARLADKVAKTLEAHG